MFAKKNYLLFTYEQVFKDLGFHGLGAESHRQAGEVKVSRWDLLTIKEKKKKKIMPSLSFNNGNKL